MLAEAANLALPDPSATDRKRWEGEVTDGVNHLHDRVDAIDERSGMWAVTFSGASAAVAQFMTERCPDGLGRDDVRLEELQAACPDFSGDEIADALGELQSYGLVEAVAFLGSGGIYTLTQRGYEAFDPPLMSWNPKEDARQIAALAVAPERRDGVNTFELEPLLGWPRRRFNPAFQIVLDFISPGGIDNTIQPYFPACGFYMTSSERAQLKRFANGR
jgi:hypothetical protein